MQSPISALLPALIGAAIGNHEVKDFCHRNAALCNLYNSDSGVATFDSAVTGATYTSSSVGSIIGGGLAGLFILVANVWTPHIIEKKLPESIKNRFRCFSSRESEPLIAPTISDSNTCTRLFRKFKENVVPTKFDAYKLIVITLALFGACAFVAWSVADAAQTQICLTDKHPCDLTFPNATYAQQHQISGLADQVYDSILSATIIFGAIASIMLATGSMVLVACAKYYMNEKLEGLFAALDKRRNNEAATLNQL